MVFKPMKKVVLLLLLSNVCSGMETPQKEKQSPPPEPSRSSRQLKSSGDLREISRRMDTWRERHLKNQMKTQSDISLNLSQASSTTSIRYDVEGKTEEGIVEEPIEIKQQVKDKLDKYAKKYAKEYVDNGINTYVKFAIVQCIVLGVLVTWVSVLSAIVFSK